MYSAHILQFFVIFFPLCFQMNFFIYSFWFLFIFYFFGVEISSAKAISGNVHIFLTDK